MTIRTSPLALALLLTTLLGWPAVAADGPPGITTQTAFPPYDPAAPACSVPVRAATPVVVAAVFIASAST